MNRLANSTSAVSTWCAAERSFASWLANWTASVDSTSPMAAITQNGMISRHRWDRPDLPHAQVRLSQYDGIVATAVASTFDSPADPTLSTR